MIDLFIWGVVIILFTSTSAIGVVLAIYYMIVKKRQNDEPSRKYSLEDQKEIN